MPMKCSNCGEPLEEGMEVCQQCGAPVETLPEETQTVQPMPEETVSCPDAPEATVAEQISQEETPGIVLNTTGQEIPKKKSVLKPILIGVGVVVLALVVLVALNFSSIVNWAVLNFGSANDIFQRVEGQNADKMTDAIADGYQKSMEQSAQNIHVQSDIRILLGEQIIDLAEASMTSNGAPVKMDWLKDIRILMDTNYQKEGYRVAIGMGLQEQSVISAEMIMRTEDGMQWVKLPELNEHYLSVQDNYASSAQIRQEILPDAQTLDRIMDRYLDIMLKHVTDVSKTKETLTLNQISQELTVVNARMSEAQLFAMYIDIAQTAKTDADLKTIVENYSQWWNEQMEEAMKDYYAGEYEPIDLYEQFVNGLDESIADMQETMKTAPTDKYLVWTLYMDAFANVVGRRIETPEGEEALKYLILTDGNRHELGAWIDTVTLTAEYTSKNGKISGNGALKENDKLLLEVELADCQPMPKPAGTIRIKPSAGLLEEMGFGTTVTDVVLEISVEALSSAIKLTAGDMDIITITMQNKILENAPIAFPEDALNSNSSYDNYLWYSGMSFETLTDNLRNANVPEAVIRALLSAFDLPIS